MTKRAFGEFIPTLPPFLAGPKKKPDKIFVVVDRIVVDRIFVVVEKHFLSASASGLRLR